MSPESEERSNLGANARYWLSDEGWERYQQMERNREQAKQNRVIGPRPVHVEPAEPVERIVERMADEVKRHDAVVFVGGWTMIVGDLDEYVESNDATDWAIGEWFGVHEIMSAAFGPNWMFDLRGGQRDKEVSNIREAVRKWLREVEETLP